MNRVGLFDSLKIGGSVYLYSGKASGGMLSSLLGSSDGRGVLAESFVLDISPSGLVRAYEQQGKWKLRFLQFELTHEGILLYIFRPPKLSLRERIQLKTSSSSPPSSERFTSPSAGPVSTTEKFSQHIASGKAVCKSRVLLSGSPVTVRKLRLAEGSSVLGSFALRRCDGLDDSEQKMKVVTVAQVLLEGNCFIEFFGRDEDHVEKWISRLNTVASIHHAFHALQKTVSNPAGFPASLRSRDEFVVSVPGTKYARIPGELHVQQTSTGFSVCIVSEPARGAELIFWRACFDESPILEPQSITFPVVRLTAVEQDRLNLGDDAFLSDRESAWLTLESISHATLGKLFYYTRWASFLGSFVKYYEELNASSDTMRASTSSRLRDVSSFVASPRVIAAANSGKCARDSDEEDESEVASSSATPQQQQQAQKSLKGSLSPTSSTSVAPIAGPGMELQVAMALEEQRSFQRSLSTSPTRGNRGPAPKEAGTTVESTRHPVAADNSVATDTSSSTFANRLPTESGGGTDSHSHASRSIPRHAAALPEGGLTLPVVTQKSLERRAADERICRQVPLMLQRGEVEAVMKSIMEFYDQHGDYCGS
jgi:hypothetical protein